jgi:glycosyltransferase involved in cell wall biosynthesis
MKKESKPKTYIDTQKTRQQVVSILNSHIQSALGRYKFNLIPTGDAQSTQYLNTFESTGKNPQIILMPKSGRFPSGPIELAMQMKTPAGLNSYFMLLYDLGNGFVKQDSLEIAFLNDKQSLIRIYLPKHVKKLRLDPCDCVGEIVLRQFEIKKISEIEILRRVIRSRNVHSLKELLTMTNNGLRILRAQGLSGIKERLKVKAEENYSTWIAMYDSLDSATIEKARKTILNFQYKPLISIIMPVYNTPELILRETLDSVTEQLYTNWELCIVDDHSSDPHVRLILEEYGKKIPQIHVRYRDVNGHISLASNDALKMANGEFIVFMDHDDLLSPTALYYVVNELNKNPELDFLYSDEDKIDESGKRYDPYFKPDWNPHLFLGQNYLNHLTAARKSLVMDVDGFRQGLEGSQDWDLYMRLIEKIDPVKICHIPYVLYHWRASTGSTALSAEEKPYIMDAQEKVLLDHFERIGQKVILQKLASGYWFPHFPCPDPLPLVSIIIPTKDKVNLLERCIQSIQSKTSYPNYEILVVDNLSQEKSSINYLQTLRNSTRIRVIEYSNPFNFSAINNFAVNQSNGSVVLLLNNDTEVITENWLEQLVSYASIPDIGAVGTMLYYPDNNIQHAGVILGIGGVAGHAYLGSPRGSNGQFGRLNLVQNLSSVTAACLAIEKRKYLEVGGLNEQDLKIAFNDVDFCIKLLQKGYRNLWTPHVELYHYESASRGYEDTPDKKKRFEAEVLYMLKKWEGILDFDPAYNPNLSLQHSNFRTPCKPRVKTL